MITETAVCLDRRVSDPPAVEAGGVTTWTLPYSVAVDGSQGRVSVVRLDTATELAVTRPSPTEVSAAGSFGGVPVVVGVAYTWSYVPATIYMTDPSGKPDLRAPVRLSYVRFSFSGTRAVDATVSTTDRPDCTVSLRSALVTKRQQLSLPVFADSEDASIVLSTDAPFPVRVGMLEWDGQFDPRTTTQVP